MKIRVPKNSEYDRVMIEVTGPDFLALVEASTELDEVECQCDVDERLLTIKAWPITNSREPAGDEVVLQQGIDPEPEEDDEVPEEDPVGDPDEATDEETEGLDEESDEVEEAPIAWPTR